MKKDKLILLYNNAVLILLLIISAFPILSRVVQSISIISLSILTIIYLLFEAKKHWSFSKTKIIFSLSIFFWVYLVTLIYSKNLSYGLNNIKIMLPIVLFPLIFLVNKERILQKKYIKMYTYIFIGSIIIFLIYLNLFVYKSLVIKDLNIIQIRDSFEKATKVHGTYFSLWIGFAVVLLLFKIRENKKNYYFITIASLIILYFIYWQNIIAARMPLLATVVFIFIFIIKNNIKLFLLLIIFFLSGIYYIPQKILFTERFERIKNYDFTFPKGDYTINWPNISTEQVRNGIYYCSYQKIKEASVLGYGVGDVDNLLQDCYDCKFTDTNTYKLIKYNSHNQYLDILLVSGFIGLFIIVFFQIKNIKIALKNKNSLYIFFLFYFLLNMSFENLFSRQDGVMFFSFFNSLLFIQLIPNNEKSINS